MSNTEKNRQDNSKNLVNFHHPDPISLATLNHWLFAPLLPWQTQAWHYVTSHYPNLPHAMLFAGNAGTGKRAFVYRFVAWTLCQQKQAQAACGACDSCQWLMAGTHPNLRQLPTLIADDSTDKSKSAKTNVAKVAKLHDESPSHQTGFTIKIDDIREMQPFVQQLSSSTRIVVIHQAESMTLGASNALLKTLEEPADNVLLLLISDTPSRLLPTIRSRLQSIAVSQITPTQSLDYMRLLAPTADLIQLQQVNQLSGFAPFVALDMLHSQWYQHRQTWLTTWQALRSHQRSAIQASDYWQKTLTLSDFLYLSQIMLTEINYQLLGLGGEQTDINLNKLEPLPTPLRLQQLQRIIDEIWRDRRQHVQDKLCYDKLLEAMQSC